MFYGHAMFIGGGSRCLSFPVAVASRGYKNWLQFEQHFSHCVFNFCFFSKKIRRQMSWHVLKLDLNSAQWLPKLVSSTLRAIRPWRHNLCALPLVRCKTIEPYSTTSTESQESYLTTGMLPYKHSSFLPPTHGSIMLPPRQPHIFARLARWQLQPKTKHLSTFLLGRSLYGCVVRLSKWNNNR